MYTRVTQIEQRVWGICLILGAALMALSTFFWEGSEYGVNVGTMGAIACVFWIPGMIGLFSLLREKMPVYATLGLVVAIYGCVGGAFFGFEGLYTATYNISQATALQGWDKYPLQFGLTLFWPGPLFPLSLLVLAIVLIRTKTVPLWIGLLLALGGVAFPLSRIPRIELIAHLVDLLLLIPAVYLGWLLFTGKKSQAIQHATHSVP